MSMGGFMTYKLACDLPQTLSAIAVVTGNMLTTLQTTCTVPNGLPVMHFHGTSDAIVNYFGSAGISSVDSTIKWWVNQNNCNSSVVFTALPNTNLSDNCTAEKYYFGGGKNRSEITLYKIINGGHTWPGSIPLQGLGNTNQDINASNIIGNFFQTFCGTVGMNELKNSDPFCLFPNPANNSINVQLPEQKFNLSLYDNFGKKIVEQNNILGNTQIDCSTFLNGIYLIKTTTEKQTFSQKIIINH